MTVCSQRARYRDDAVREAPSVNAYLLALRCVIERRLGVPAVPYLPPGKRCTIVLSHDVDNPINPADPRHRFWLAGQSARGRRFREAGTHAVRGLARSAVQFPKGRIARHWLFDDVAAAEERHGFRSTFFFAVASSLTAGGDPLDVVYDASAPRFSPVFRDLGARGFDVGLHISYGVLDDSRRLRAEKSLLERLAARPVLGSRHHFWHMTRPFWPTLEAHAEAGLAYDSSIAFNKSPGFRLAIGFPFRPGIRSPSERSERSRFPPSSWTAPSLPPGATVTSTLERVSAIVDTLKSYEAVAALDWHDYTSHPATSLAFRPWGEAYLEILDLLAADPEVAIATFPEITARWSVPRPGSLQ